MNSLHTKNEVWFGTWDLPADKSYEIVTTALETGYHYFDFADVYQNQGEIGRAITDFFKNHKDEKRENYFFQSKVFYEPQIPMVADIDAGIKRIYESLQLDYLDSILVHRPCYRNDDSLKAYQAIVDLQKQGKVKHVGLSNYDKDLIFWLYKKTGVMPEANQIEFNVLNQRYDRLAFAKKNNISIQAYSPLNGSLHVKELVPIAKENNCSVAQLVIAWVLHLGLVPLVRSTNKDHIIDNFNATKVKLSNEDVQKLNKLNKYHAFAPETFIASEFVTDPSYRDGWEKIQ